MRPVSGYFEESLWGQGGKEEFARRLKRWDGKIVIVGFGQVDETKRMGDLSCTKLPKLCPIAHFSACQRRYGSFSLADFADDEGFYLWPSDNVQRACIVGNFFPKWQKKYFQTTVRFIQGDSGGGIVVRDRNSSGAATVVGIFSSVGEV